MVERYVRVSCRSMYDWKGTGQGDWEGGVGVISRKDGLCELKREGKILR